eukprot:11494-Heterococcus_DN1.PRE.2
MHAAASAKPHGLHHISDKHNLNDSALIADSDVNYIYALSRQMSGRVKGKVVVLSFVGFTCAVIGVTHIYLPYYSSAAQKRRAAVADEVKLRACQGRAKLLVPGRNEHPVSIAAAA